VVQKDLCFKYSVNTGTTEENHSCQLIYCLTHEPNQFQEVSISRNMVCWHAAEML